MNELPRLPDFPVSRPRRLRRTPALRRLVADGDAYPPAGQRFLRAYNSRYGNEPTAANFGYAAMSLLLDAIHAAIAQDQHQVTRSSVRTGSAGGSSARVPAVLDQVFDARRAALLGNLNALVHFDAAPGMRNRERHVARLHQARV